MPMTTFIDVTNSSDLYLLKVKVDFENVEYEPSLKRTTAYVRISLDYGKNKYRYGNVTVDAQASASDLIKLQIGEAQNVNTLLQEIRNAATKELDKIKSEVRTILMKNIPKVSIDMDDALERILSSEPIALARKSE